MTKLTEWLLVLSFLGAVWLSLITNKFETTFTKQYPNVILFAPVIAIGLFGIYAAVVILYRVFTFNDCQEAAAELQQEIKDARADLTRLGFQFKS